jgi:hypothetical protein
MLPRLTLAAEDVEIRALDDNRVLSTFTIIATGKGSGIELERDDASITELRDGKVVRTAYYSDRTQALTAAGFTSSGR